MTIRWVCQKLVPRTRRDLLGGNRDLHSFCAQTLRDWSWS